MRKVVRGEMMLFLFSLFFFKDCDCVAVHYKSVDEERGRCLKR